MTVRHAVSGLVLSTIALAAPLAFAADSSKERYYFELKGVTAKPELEANAVRMATPRVLSEVKKAFDHQPQIVGKLEAAPDPKASPDEYRVFLAKEKIADAYSVKVEITDAAQVLTAIADKPGAQMLEIRLALRMLGSHVPDDTLGFTGRGKGTIKQEVGLQVKERDRQETWDQVAELAVSAAVKTALDELALVGKTKPKQKQKTKP